MEVRLSELAARASEVAVGAGDQDAYRNDVDDLIGQLEGMRLALDETADRRRGTSGRPNRRHRVPADG